MQQKSFCPLVSRLNPVLVHQKKSLSTNLLLIFNTKDLNVICDLTMSEWRKATGNRAEKWNMKVVRLLKNNVWGLWSDSLQFFPFFSLTFHCVCCCNYFHFGEFNILPKQTDGFWTPALSPSCQFKSVQKNKGDLKQSSKLYRKKVLLLCSL